MQKRGREKAFINRCSRCRCRGGRNGLGGLAKGESWKMEDTFVPYFATAAKIRADWPKHQESIFASNSPH